MSLLIGSMGWIFALAAGRLDSFPVNDTQAIEFLLTAAFALFQIAIIYKSKFNNNIATEITKADIFYSAEDYHQRFIQKRKETA